MKIINQGSLHVSVLLILIPALVYIQFAIASWVNEVQGV